MITLQQFKEMDIRIGTVESAAKIENSSKLLKLVIDFGTEKRQIVAGMGEFFEPTYFIDKQVPVLLNIESRFFRGVESQGMLLAADVKGKPALLHPEIIIPPGSIVR